MESTYYTKQNGGRERVWVNGKGEVRVESATHSSNPHVPATRWYLVARPADPVAYAAKKVARGDWVPEAKRPQPAPELHRVVAVLSSDDERVVCTEPLTWAAAQAVWDTLDDYRMKGHMPHVRYYAVRSVDDPQWQGLRLAKDTLVPHAHQPMPDKRPTSHQAGVLDALVRRSTGGLAPENWGVGCHMAALRWVKETGLGGPMGLYHLYRKGYAELDVRVGPRGGEHNYYRPTYAGVAYATRRRVRQQLEAVAAG